MKTSGSDLKVNRNMYPHAVTCDRMRLIGPKFDQLGSITLTDVLESVYIKTQNPVLCKQKEFVFSLGLLK